MIRKTRIPAWECRCEVCNWPHDRKKPWYSVGQKLPDCCPNPECRSREWNGKKSKTIKPNIALPKPIRVRAQDDDF